MKFHGFEEINHTADLALRVWGEDYKSLLTQAAKGLYHLLILKTKQNSMIINSFSVEEASQESMLVDFLNELLFLCDDCKQCFSSFIFIDEVYGLRITGEGKKVISIERNIKAVTFHDLDIRVCKTGLETTITFDV
jgi:SHS2 domain-containing protein